MNETVIDTGEAATTMSRRWAPGRPVSLMATLGTLRRGSGDPTWRSTPGGFATTWHTPGGCVAVRFTEHARLGEIEVTGWGPGAEWVCDRLPQMLGADDDPTGFVPHHDLVAELWRRFPGWRVPSTGLVVAALVPAVIEQLVTGAEAFAGYRYLVRKFGDPAPGPFGLTTPPTPRRWMSIPSWEWARAGVDATRASTVLRAVSYAGRLDECAHLPLQTAHRRMRAIPGIGVWTAAEVAQRALGDADAVSFGDYHVPADIGWALTGSPVDDDGLAELLAPYAGHRFRVQRLLELGGIHRPRRGPRMTIRTHTPSVARRR
ncbi:DNA-3-methyladenine glycosylase family protein [Mobilicoccus massiliensis]|uniref:DNA-3-methyladenine glycosylase family protein n=1 Tax=Mobilicoccus massiliensis TaxID=1522310 RepID=UPI000A836811|nr:DNA-3-methyladenine glycosylase 2 family protein [Mobilicoccus massiliensis]